MLLLPITFLKNLFTCELANIVASDQLFLSWFFRFLFLWVNWWTLLLPITFLIKLWNILLMIIWKFLESFEIPFPTSPPPSLQQLPKRTKLFEFHHKKISVLPFQRTHSPLIQSLQVSFRNNHHLCSMAHRPAYHKAHSLTPFKSLNRCKRCNKKDYKDHNNWPLSCRKALGLLWGLCSKRARWSLSQGLGKSINIREGVPIWRCLVLW